MGVAEWLVIITLLFGCLWGLLTYFIRTQGSKVDGLMTRVAKLEANQIDSEKVREIVDTSLDRAMQPPNRRLEHIERVLEDVRFSVATSVARRRRNDPHNGGEDG